MAINLKQISTSDSDNIKLDKVNYNFDQLVANGGGPRGITGSKGDTGFQGVAGPQGPQGIMGPQGFQGPAGSNQESYWIRKTGDTGSLTTDTLFPAVSETALNPPVISIGFLSTDIEYNNYQSLTSGESPYQWIINRKNHFASNLRFKSSDVLDNNFDFKIYHDTVLDKTTFRMAFTDQTATPTRLIWDAENHIFKSNILGGDLLLINETNITFYKDTHHNSPVTINNDLYIEGANAGTDKVATSVDSSGLVEFKGIRELGGIVPYGTIISMLPSVFSDNANFINSETIDLNTPPNTIDDVLKIRVGAGVGDYEGWYLCNGKEWIDDITSTTHLVPDLNSFSYTIEDNPLSILPTSQGTAETINDDINILGGSDIDMDANISGPGVYNITSSVQTTDVNINTVEGGTSFKIKKLPQIIYLVEPNLYWKDAGTGQAPDTTVTYVFDDLGTENIPNVSDSVTIQQGTSSTESVNIEAPAGYEWNGSPTFSYSSPISNVTTSLISATTLQVTYTISAQPTNGTIVTITYNSDGFLDIIPLSTITINDDTAVGSINFATITDNSIFAAHTREPGTNYDFSPNKIEITADVGYEFTQNEVDNLIINGIDPGDSITWSASLGGTGEGNKIIILFNCVVWPSIDEIYNLDILTSAVSIYNIDVTSDFPITSTGWSVTYVNNIDPSITHTSTGGGNIENDNYRANVSNQVIVDVNSNGQASNSGTITWDINGGINSTYAFNLDEIVSETRTLTVNPGDSIFINIVE